MLKILTIIGARPQIIKAAALSRAIKNKYADKIQEVIAKLQATTIKVGAKVGQNDKIFGSITNVQLAEGIKKQLGLVIDRKKIVLPEEVKTLGTYAATISLDKDHNIPVNFEVVEG